MNVLNLLYSFCLIVPLLLLPHTSLAVRDCPAGMIKMNLRLANLNQVDNLLNNTAAGDCLCPGGYLSSFDILNQAPLIGKCPNVYASNIPRTVSSQAANALVLWLDASDPYGNGVVPPHNTPIMTWRDKSGRGNHAISTSTTTSMIPVFQYVKPTNANQSGFSFPAITFNGTNQAYSITFNSGFTSGLSIYVLVRHTFSANNGIFERKASTTAAAGDIGLWATGANHLYQFQIRGSSSITPNTATPLTSDEFALLYITHTAGNSLSMRRNNLAVGTSFGGSAVSTQSSPLYIGRRAPAMGASTFLNGSIAELIIYDRVLTATEDALILSFLNQKWGIREAAW